MIFCYIKIFITVIKYINKKGPSLIEKIGLKLNPLFLKFTRENNQILIFFFHGFYLTEEQKTLDHVDPQYNFTISEFQDFLTYFQHHKYIFISPKDIQKGLQPGQRYAMITFDDGYFNNTYVINVLETFKVPAVVFVTTKNMMENTSYWWDIIYKYRKKQGVSLAEIRQEQTRLKTHKHSYIEKYIEENFGRDSFKPLSDIDRPFNQNELKNLSNNPLITIGNHTHNHTILINYNRKEILEEFQLSNQIISNITGKKPTSVAFPNGDFNKLVVSIAQEVGFIFYYTVKQKKNPIRVMNSGINCFDRMMAISFNIKHYGTFYRIGYTSNDLYSQFKSLLKVKNK